MKIITVETKYYLLKPHEVQTGKEYKYYYIKVENGLMPDRAVWMQGYINHLGGVSTVGAPIMNKERVAELDKEFEEAMQTDSQSKLNCYYYDCAQGKHYCTNPVVKAKRCNGVCKDYKSK